MEQVDQYSGRLLAVSQQVVDIWTQRLIDRHCSPEQLAPAQVILERAAVVSNVRFYVVSELQQLLATDVEQQRVNPLAIFRSAIQPLTDFFESLNCHHVPRDEFNRRSFPGDVFGLSPATWADIDERLIEPGLEWGAFKAATMISRRKNL